MYKPVNENRGPGYIGFVKNRSPMKALTNHVVPSRSAQLLHFPMVFPSSLYPPPLPPLPRRTGQNFSLFFSAPSTLPCPYWDTILFPPREGAAHMRARASITHQSSLDEIKGVVNNAFRSGITACYRTRCSRSKISLKMLI